MTLYLLAMIGMYCGGLASAITAPRSGRRTVRMVISTALILWPLCLLLHRE